MKKRNIIKSNLDFARIIKSTKPLKHRDFIIYIEYTLDDHYEFGISVSKKLGNAVIRNKLKRQIKSIIDKKHYEKSFKCIIILRRNILQKRYDEISRELLYCLGKMDIFKEELSEEEK